MGNKINEFEAINSLKKIKGKIKKSQDDIYLINAKLIPNFLNINENSKNKKNEFSDEDLSNIIRKYKDENFEFLTNFVQCWRLAEQDIENENKFIIADDSFMKNMNIDIKRIKNKKVKIEVDDKNNKRILFKNCSRRIAFEEIGNILYKFVESDDNKSLMIDSIDNEYENNNDKLNPQGIFMCKKKISNERKKRK